MLAHASEDQLRVPSVGGMPPTEQTTAQSYEERRRDDLATRMLRLSAADLLHLHGRLHDHLGALVKDDPAERQLEDQDRALTALNRVSEHLGLDQAGKSALTVERYEETAAELELEISSAKIIRDWGSWRAARQVLTGERLPVNRMQRVREAKLARKRLRCEEVLVSVSAWLATDPDPLTTAEYDRWRVRANRELSPEARSHASSQTVVLTLGLGWSDVIRTAAGEEPKGQVIRRKLIDATASRRVAEEDGAPYESHNLAIRMRAARLKRGWSQQRLALESGLGQPSVSKIERGVQPWVALASVVRVTRALSISTGALLDLETEAWAAYLEQVEEI